MAPTDRDQLDMHIGGGWAGSVSGRRYGSVDPYRGRVWADVPDATSDDVDRAVDAARAALVGSWGRMTGFERAALMRRLADKIRDSSHELAKVESRDNGKLLREMQGQVDYLPAWLDYFAGLGDKLEGATIPSDRNNFFIYTRHEPVGVVAAIVPWNSPLMLMMWKLAPALAAGCTFVLKPSDQTPASALRFAKCVEDASFPPGVFNVVTGQGPDVGRALVDHPGVDKVAFTGSTRVGRVVARQAGGRLASVSLELGGKSAQLVFGDANFEATVNGVIAGIFAATGQTCIAGSRLLVQRSLHDRLVEALVERAERIRLGDPMDPASEMGPVTSEAHLQTVLGFIERAEQQGAKLVTGGHREDVGKLFVGPTILTEVMPRMEIACEEVFGPVLAVMPFDDEEEALELANGTDYGLAAGVWTQDVQRAHRMAHRLDAGTIWINSYRVVAPNAPFGGSKMSGIGRESGLDAVRDFTETKTVWLDLEGATRDPFKLG